MTADNRNIGNIYRSQPTGKRPPRTPRDNVNRYLEEMGIQENWETTAHDREK